VFLFLTGDNMKRVRKLTPATLKRIIAEEKFKLIKLQKKKSSVSGKQIIESYLKIIKLLNETKTKKQSDLKKIEAVKSVIKRKLLKRL
tara:strand:- start:591 stop:854 length:264 start_codon:yes stop_codon:yes gene_type:complete